MKPLVALFAMMLLCNGMTMASEIKAKAELYVAVNGKDTNPGTFTKPFATLERARDAIRSIKTSGGLPDGGVAVWIRGGHYPLLKTFELTAVDSGAKAAPIVYRAYEGEEVRLIGGQEIKGFKPVADQSVLDRIEPSARRKIVACDLKGQGITDYGKLTVRGFGKTTVPSQMELFWNDKPMTLATWPNNDWDKIADVPAGKDGGKFTYAGDRPNRWAKADDIWLHGYWTYPWAESYVKVKSINTQTKEIETEPPHGVYGYLAKCRWRALNLLEELDEPGEYYLDRNSGMLYFWPPSPISKGRAVVSIIEQPMVSLKDASFVTIRGLTLEACRGLAIEMTGGASNLIAGCVIKNIGAEAVLINGGTNNGIMSCDISDIGDAAISLSGGDRMTLTPGGNYAVNCRITRFSRWDRTYRCAVHVSGVGNRVAHNLMYDAPHMAIGLAGNDHVVEFNEVHHVCGETGDAGAFYMGRDWTQQGNVIRFNYFHDIEAVRGKTDISSFPDTMGVYLDDLTCGTRVYGNVFHNIIRAILIGGGRDNSVENNIIVDCEIGLHLDARGVGWANDWINGKDNTLYNHFKALKADQPPYSTRYPKLALIPKDEPAAPKGNVVVRNIFIGKQWLDGDGTKSEWADIRDNLLNGDPLFVDAEKGNFQLKDDSPAFKLGFKRIPMDKIGLYKDEYRTHTR